MAFRAALKCKSCGEYERPKVFWSNETRVRLLRRCKTCRANFDGPGIWMPQSYMPMHVAIEAPVDNCSTHTHGHGPCDKMEDPRQIKLL